MEDEDEVEVTENPLDKYERSPKEEGDKDKQGPEGS